MPCKTITHTISLLFYFPTRSPPYFPGYIVARWGRHIFRSSLLATSYLSEPEAFDVFEALLFGDVVDDDDGVGTFVICAGYGSEALLACGVPYLEFDDVALDCDGPWLSFHVLEPEINTDGGEITLLEGVICKSPEERGLADRAVSNQDYFKEVIVLADHDL